MKQWKYIKGSEKDFENAPDWAKLYCKGDKLNIYYENIDYSGKWQNENSSYTGYNGRGNYPIIAQRELIEVYDGKSLPPVGTICQWDNGENDWCNVKVMGISDGELWVKPLDGSQSFVVCDGDFRPLPTGRDLAVSDMCKCLTNYNKTDVIHACEQLYDAGYRKQPDLVDGYDIYHWSSLAKERFHQFNMLETETIAIRKMIREHCKSLKNNMKQLGIAYDDI